MRMNKKGFTFIELLVVIAIIGILAAVVIFYSTNFTKRARSTRAMAQASSGIPAMISCWGNSGKVNSSGQICTLGSSYGNWPTMPMDYTYSGIPSDKTNSWFFTVSSIKDNMIICCNSTMNSCGIPSGACSATATW